MRTLKLLVAPAIVLVLAGCLENDTERAVAGAATGAAVGVATDGNVAATTAIGAAAGALCDDVGVCN
ncbi:MAG: hypothetical protein CL814_14540 [Confluentimicrobium sp.]|jgi:osmotically inducible lipoprotein OsmB|uniref:hypothetical protein n=1 Tax=Actibacterium sp. TaxID=1872125 RepID=UPI000C35675C|nr:hypothetical protein [Actibacterium sp.]MBC58132.1 hypothetical protein [Actibacterium sp.]MDY6859385.1 hypothetical protein [Pseudomonadota bacterium]|tara:strand:- start:1935 stop:2135 length:201 start_codon:yes stop_codon:yes gene_type:complete